VAPQTTRVGDLTVAVERPASPGFKPPVVLIHGFCGGAWYWEGYQRLLAERGYESHAINLRGHHGSRPVANIGAVRLADYVDDARAVLATLKNPIVVGHSMGGLIAQKVAEGGGCKAVVLMASAPPRWIPIASWRLAISQLKYIGDMISAMPIVPGRRDADTLMFNRTPPADRAAFFPRLVPDSGRVGLELSLGTMGVSASRVTAPMLVVSGTDDQFVVPRIARAISDKYRAPLKLYPSFAHHIMSEPGWEKPASDIIDWMDSR
jgi:pimeloyl-ACP methyl ester carboxylesterase